MALNFNGTNVPQSGAVNLNGAAAKAVQANGVVVWRKEIDLWNNGQYGSGGTPYVSYTADGGVGQVNVVGGSLRIRGTQNVKIFFPNAIDTSGFSKINFSIDMLDHKGNTFLAGWGPALNNLTSTYDVRTQGGNYTFSLTVSGTIYAGFHIVASGQWPEVGFNRIWMD